MTAGFEAWLAQQHSQATWWDGLTEDVLRQLYESYPGLNLNDVVLLAIRKNPEAFTDLGIKVAPDKRHQ